MEFSKQKLNAIKKVKEDRWGLSQLKQFRKDRDVALEALKCHGDCVYSGIDDSLRGDKELLLYGLNGSIYYNLTDEKLAKDEDVQRAYVKALQCYFDDSLLKALESLEKDDRDFIKLDSDIVKRFWDSRVSLENLYQWFVDNGLTDRLPDQIQFKVDQLHNRIDRAKKRILETKRELTDYFKINEFDFGRSQWSVKGASENLMEAYDNYIELKESFSEDLKRVQSSKNRDLSFLMEMEKLDLSNSKIESLPEDIKLMWSLHNLDISNTKIKDIDIDFHNYRRPNLNISKTPIAITPELLKKVAVSEFSIETKIDPSLLKLFKHITEKFVQEEKNPIKKIKLAQKYGIEQVRIEPDSLTDRFFELDFSGVKLIDLYSSHIPIDESFAKKLDNLEPETVYTYGTTWGALKERFRSEFSEDQFKEIMANLDEVYRADASDSEEMTIVSYLDFNGDYLELECSKEKASIIANGTIYSEDEALIVLNSDEIWGVTVTLFDEVRVDAGVFEWSYEYTDTNDGALEQYRVNCSAELENLSLEDGILYLIGDKDGKDIVEEYKIDYEQEEEGVYY